MTTIKNLPPNQELLTELDHKKIEDRLSMEHISSTWTNRGWSKPLAYILPKLPHISTSVERCAVPSHYGSFYWTDTITGKSGRGPIELVSHVLKIPLEEAARRIALFLVPGPSVSKYLLKGGPS